MKTFAEFRAQAGRHLVAALAATVLLAGCGGGGDSSSATSSSSLGTGTSTSSTSSTTATATTTSAASNVLAIKIDNGPSGITNRVANIPYVSLTICPPGSSSGCQVIDHVIVDTGSYGLRLMASVLNNLSGLPLQQNTAGNAYAECGQFVSGYTWGSVRTGDVTLGDMKVPSLPLQVIADPAFSSVPTSCSSTGSNQGTVSALGGNGILGIGYFLQDCGIACANKAIAGAYYSCPTSTFCSASAIPVAQQVANPVAGLPSDNNGTVVQLPAVPAGGATGVTGSLIFGIGTRSNNALGSATAYGVSPSTGYLTTVYNSRSYTHSFIDSGSNFYFFNDSTLTACTGATSGFYCPSSTRSLTAQLQGQGSINTSGTVSFSVANAASTFSNFGAATAFSDVAATSTDSTSFDWGLPFFFGRSVFTALEGASTPAGTGPYVAF
ncbi:DUF3443 domain-containing protein [Xylophilus sp. GW821-FHT01B05]